jgi:PadR family transcriptional regulator, regulatory protein PadR
VESASGADFISKFDNSQVKFPLPCAIFIPVTDHRRELYYGLIRIHVLLHAAEEPIFGLDMMAELSHHGYRIGPGTLYPLLHGMEKGGLLKSATDAATGRRRRVYRITAAGRRALSQAREKVDELYHELHEKHPHVRREKRIR